jgi:hypothetical protein
MTGQNPARQVKRKTFRRIEGWGLEKTSNANLDLELLSEEFSKM